MYSKYYGLRENPFDLAPKGGLVYLSDTHREGLAILKYGVLGNKGFVLLTGGIGTGKTTILNTLLGSLKDKTRICVINNPTLTKLEFYHYLGQKFFIDSNNKSEFILKFTEHLYRYNETGIKVLLIIDEAQAFSIQLLEEIRLLSNLAGEMNVLSTFLIGQPELQKKLSNPKLLPLRQRIGVTYQLKPLSKSDTCQYIVYRLNQAGAANPALFTKKALDRIYKESKGNPRLINILCDNALLLGFSKESRTVTEKILTDSLKTSRFEGEETIFISPTDGHKVPPSDVNPKSTTKRVTRFLKAAGIFAALCLICLYALRYLS